MELVGRAIIAAILVICAYFLAGEYRYTKWIPQRVDHAWEEAHPDAYANVRTLQELQKAQASRPQTQEQTFFPATPANGKVHDPFWVLAQKPQVPEKEEEIRDVKSYYIPEPDDPRSEAPVTIVYQGGQSVVVKPGEKTPELTPQKVIYSDGTAYWELVFKYPDGQRVRERIPLKKN